MNELKEVEVPPISPNIIFGDQKDRPELRSSNTDFFGPGSNGDRRTLKSYDELKSHVEALKLLRKQIVLTMGVFDLIHIGQSRYLEEAKARGDILIVGVESDEAVRIRKGPRRPVVPFSERVEMLCHLRHVDLVVPILDFDPNTGLSGLQLHEIIRPNVVVASIRSFREDDTTGEWVNRVKEYCERVEILESQAETSTTNQIRNFIIHYADIIAESVERIKTRTTQVIEETFTELSQTIQKTVEDI